MKRKELQTTSKYYQRIQTALSNEFLPKFRLRFTWTPPTLDNRTTSEICPSSVAKYFTDLGYHVDLIQTECKISQEYGLQIPLLGPNQDKPSKLNGIKKFYATPHQLVEYAGLLALSCGMDKTEYLNSWSFHGHTIEVGTALVVRLTGMFTGELIESLFKKLK